MTDRPIIFSAPMVRALLEGRKTQTRRILDNKRAVMRERDDALDCVRFHVGDRLYVREHWRTVAMWDEIPPRDFGTIAPIKFEADDAKSEPPYWASLGQPVEYGRFRQGMHMPRWASRLTLAVTDVRVQRLQEITLGDICEEGLALSIYDFAPVQRGFAAFQALWNSLHGPEAWDANPWVGALTFTVHHGNIDRIEARK